MKQLIAPCVCGMMALALSAPLSGQQAPPRVEALAGLPGNAAPPAVTAEAVKAVGDLGDLVVTGRLEVTLERMNPQWKQRAAQRAGGVEALQAALAEVPRMMEREGISIIAFRPQGQPQSFEVWPGKEVDPATGEEKLIYTRWLVLVPTVTRLRMFAEGEPRPVVIETTGFQVAVSDKDKNDWTFIDGSSLTVNELRSLFINLPEDMELPPHDRRLVQE